MAAHGWGVAHAAPFGAAAPTFSQPGFGSPPQQQRQQQLKCAACGVNKTSSNFSPNQIRKMAARRCKQCVNGVAQGTATTGFQFQPQQAQPAQGFTWDKQPQKQAQPVGTVPATPDFTWGKPQQPQQQVQPAGTKPVVPGFTWQPQQQAQPAGAQPAAAAQGLTWNFQQAPATHSSQAKPQAKPAWSFTTGVNSPPTQAPTSPASTNADPGAATSNALGKDSAPQPVHTGVGCDLCGTLITGARYKCLCCPNFDACSACIAKDPLGTARAATGVAGSSCCKHDVLVRVCEPRWMAIGAEALQNQSDWAHPGFSCSGCGVKTIVGRRYTCTVCDNTHFCERCDFCGVHAAAGLEPHPMLRVNPTARLGTTAAAVSTPPASPAAAVAAEGKLAASPKCFCCGWPQHEAAARGHRKRSP
jgi:hypothetical protein